MTTQFFPSFILKDRVGPQSYIKEIESAIYFYEMKQKINSFLSHLSHNIVGKYLQDYLTLFCIFGKFDHYMVWKCDKKLKLTFLALPPSYQSTGCARDRDLHTQKHWTPNFFGFVKTIKLLITQKNEDTSTKSQLGHDAPK